MMSLIKRNNPVMSLNPFFTDFFDSEDFGFNRIWSKDWIPAVNIAEEDSKYEIELAVPGMRKDDFKLKIENGMLTISAECKEEKEKKDKNYTRQEYKYRSFSRSFTLPENAKEDGIQARYEDGMLKLEIKKKELVTTKPKEITVA